MPFHLWLPESEQNSNWSSDENHCIKVLSMLHKALSCSAQSYSWSECLRAHYVPGWWMNKNYKWTWCRCLLCRAPRKATRTATRAVGGVHGVTRSTTRRRCNRKCRAWRTAPRKRKRWTTLALSLSSLSLSLFSLSLLSRLLPLFSLSSISVLVSLSVSADVVCGQMTDE